MKLELGAFTQKVYLLALQLEQPFTVEQLTSTIQVAHPKWTTKNTRVRIQDMLHQRLLIKQRKGLKFYYTCVLSEEEFLTAEFICGKIYNPNDNPFICGL